ncbi:MAG TPA: Fic family protein [Gammaproteobacteria bacterium]|nr:Fic family protein [Gammaproteobacteria bacterium]
MAPTDKKWKMKPDSGKALMLAQREIAVFVCDAVNLEGITMTLPEVQTLLDGITVGGHKVNDQQITINQGKAWDHLFSSIKQNSFILNAEYACKLHSIAAKEETLEWGVFRSGGVNIGGTEYAPPDCKRLPELFKEMASSAQLIDDIYDRAIFVFLEMSKNQFFYDVNKRMGRFMMNAILLDEGYPAINLPAKRQLEFNQLMLEFYNTEDMKPMNNFMRSCLDHKIIKIMLEDRPHTLKM